MSCPDDNVLVAFASGTAPPATIAGVEAHIDDCSDCRQVLSALAPVTAPVDAKGSLFSGAGRIIAGKYRIDRILGAGGMGVVAAATHLQLGQTVALKFMQPDHKRDASAVGRFMREAQAAARLKSPHIGRVIDVGGLESGEPYIVMEYLQGIDLGQLLSTQGPLSVALAAKYMRQALDALGEAHGQGIVHRDLKPANLFLSRGPNADHHLKILDFGISKFIEPTDDIGYVTTQPGALIGSPLYMAPEQLTPGAQLDARSDLWSVGCILYQLVSGRPPFSGDTLGDLTAQILRDDPSPLSTHARVPAAFEAVVVRCLQKNRALRFADAAELSQALLPFESAMPTHRLAPTRRRKLGWAIAAAAAVLGAGAVFLRTASEPVEAPPSVPLQAPSVALEPTPEPVVAQPSAPPEKARPTATPPDPAYSRRK